MAKRLKLDSASLTKAMEVQELMTNSEADKIIELNHKMKSVVENSSVSTEEKVKQFEQVLAEFRQVQNKIVKNGGVSMIRDQVKMSEDDKKEFREMITGVVKEILLSRQSGQPQEGDIKGPASSHPPPNHSTHVIGTPVPLPKGIQSTSAATPLAEIATPSEKLMPIEDPLDLVNILKKEGLAFTDEDKKVLFPVGETLGLQGSFTKPKGAKYAASTFDRAMKYLLSTDEKAERPFHTDGVISAIYDTIKETDEMARLSKLYPNLKKMHVEKKVSPSKPITWDELF